jgi:hypothetical protein
MHRPSQLLAPEAALEMLQTFAGIHRQAIRAF